VGCTEREREGGERERERESEREGSLIASFRGVDTISLF
jgi:hypothetical protein